jgi:hypothetical protein
MAQVLEAEGTYNVFIGRVGEDGGQHWVVVVVLALVSQDHYQDDYDEDEHDEKATGYESVLDVFLAVA